MFIRLSGTNSLRRTKVMKIISADVPDSYLKLIEKCSECAGINRPEHLRLEIRSQIRRELLDDEELEKELEDKKITGFFDYCINCEIKLYNEARNRHFYHKDIEVFELKFCCACYRQFKDISFDDFPTHIINNIRKKIKKYKRNIE